MGGYPPGMGRRDKIRAGIIQPHSHECRFPPDDPDGPWFEEHTASFSIQCEYVEGEYGEGWNCEEEKSYTMELSWLEHLREGAANIYYLASEFDNLPCVTEPGLIEVEQSGTVVDCDPDPDYGSVTVESENWRAKYTAQDRPQIEPRPR